VQCQQSLRAIAIRRLPSARSSCSFRLQSPIAIEMWLIRERQTGSTAAWAEAAITTSGQHLFPSPFFAAGGGPINDGPDSHVHRSEGDWSIIEAPYVLPMPSGWSATVTALFALPSSRHSSLSRNTHPQHGSFEDRLIFELDSGSSTIGNAGRRLPTRDPCRYC